MTHSHGDENHLHAMPMPFGEQSEVIFAIASGVFLALGFGLNFVGGLTTWLPIVFYLLAFFCGGFYTSIEAYYAIRHGQFEIDFLMLAAAAGAAFLGEWAEGALLLFLFSIGHALEHYAMGKAQKSIESLSGLAVKTAFVKQGDQLVETPIEAIKTGSVVVVKPNSKIPVDGVVIQGQSTVNQASITGESIPVEKYPIDNIPDISLPLDKISPKHRTFAGSINGAGLLEINVWRAAEDSTIARLIRMVQEAQNQKSPTQQLADKVQKYYVPAVLALVALLLLSPLLTGEVFSKAFYRAMAVLVAASPCALAISTPSAVLSGIARAARGGVLLKGGRPLEALGSLKALAFDKTGTLTMGEPHIVDILPFDGVSEQELLEITVAGEMGSDHPLAQAIVQDGLRRLGKSVEKSASNLKAIPGKGLSATLEGKRIFIGNKALFQGISEQKLLPNALIEAQNNLISKGQTTMIVQYDGRFLGIIGLQDTPRPEAPAALKRLKELGIKHMIMISGDNQKVAETIAKQIGLTDAIGDLMPEDKVAAIKKLQENGQQVGMVGDGVNDAPAMASSTVGIAMGAAGSDVALETADVALMSDNLSNLPFAIGLSRLANRIIRQNLVISIGMVILLIPLTLFGLANMTWAVILHEGSTILVVFNALRLLAYRE